jgi:hypothetical protein
MRERLSHVAKNAGQRLVRAWKWLGVLFLDVAKDLLKDRYSGSINRYLDVHSSGIFGALRPVLRWILNSPFAISLLVITAVVIIVIIHAAVDESRKGTRDINKSSEKPQEQIRISWVESYGSEARLTVTNHGEPAEFSASATIKEVKSLRRTRGGYLPSGLHG